MIFEFGSNFTYCIGVGHTSIGPYFRDSGQTWKMSFILFISDVCQGASIYHAALIVLLRCLSIARPLSFTAWHKKFTKRCLYGIWIGMIITIIIPNMICTKGFTTLKFPKGYLEIYGEAWKVVRHVTFTVPIGLIIIFYISQLYFLKPHGDKELQSDVTIAQKKATERMIHMITISTLVCYVPYAVWMQYNILEIRQNTAHQVFDSVGKVCSVYPVSV